MGHSQSKCEICSKNSNDVQNKTHREYYSMFKPIIYGRSYLDTYAFTKYRDGLWDNELSSE